MGGIHVSLHYFKRISSLNVFINFIFRRGDRVFQIYQGFTNCTLHSVFFFFFIWVFGFFGVWLSSPSSSFFPSWLVLPLCLFHININMFSRHPVYISHVMPLRARWYCCAFWLRSTFHVLIWPQTVCVWLGRSDISQLLMHGNCAVTAKKPCFKAQAAPAQPFHYNCVLHTYSKLDMICVAQQPRCSNLIFYHGTLALWCCGSSQPANVSFF